MNGLPNGYTIRPATLEDIDIMAAMVNDYTTQAIGEAAFAPEQLRMYLTVPGVDLATSSKVVFSPCGEVSAIALVMDFAAPHVNASAFGIVREEDQGKGIGTTLHSWIEPRARQAINKAPKDARVFISQSVFDQEEAAKTLLEHLGYVQTRHFWRMAADLADVVVTPKWPEGITVHNVDLRESLEQPMRAANEAFRDHYGHIDGNFEERVERRRHNLMNDPDYSPEWSFLAMDGDDIAGVCFCSPKSGVDATIGYVQTLGVLRPWRKRGLGLALLHHAFAAFKHKGKLRSALHVDAQSLTGATRLYEKAGMHVDQLNHEYQLELRPGIDLAAK